MNMNFNPNQPTKTKRYLWATYIPDRYPEFKLHHQSNHAKSAFQYRSNAILYMWNSTTESWDEVFRVEKGHFPTCVHGGSLNKNGEHSYHRWIGKDMDSQYVGVCHACYRGRVELA